MTTPPPRRLVLEIPPTRQITTRDFRLFMEAMKGQGVEDGTDVTVAIERDGSLKFSVPVPPRELPKQTRREKAVAAQIASRRAKVAAGEEVPGYVPPVKEKRVVRLPKQKSKRIVKVAKKAREDGSSNG
ncbi:hypothetical protein [Streptomyces sp. NPDC006477]|uniref:hypothetical protein n=1 Tax=Streptomyces sp. NPDC006477 TaxID=3364747 RepID=UPI003682BD69